MNMIIPIRCMSCGKPIAQLWEQFKERVEKGDAPGEILTDLGLERYCCRAAFMGQTDLLELTTKFKKS